MKGKIRRICALLFAVVMICGSIPVSAAANTVNIPVHGVRSGKYLYYAIGNDGGGSIYRYNISTGNQARVVLGKCSRISVKGKYLYYELNTYGGSDGSSYYIYRVGINGKGKQKLADGRCPVVIGNYVYYIGVAKQEYYGGQMVDGRTLGVYRMGLNGSGKKLISGNTSIYTLGAGSNQLYMMPPESSSWTAYNVKTGKTSQVSMSGYSLNTEYRYGANRKFYTYSNIIGKGYKFTYEGGTVYRWKGSTKKKLVNLGGSIDKIFYTNGSLVAITHKRTTQYPEVAYVYTFNYKGQGKKLLDSFPVAGGGWYY